MRHKIHDFTVAYVWNDSNRKRKLYIHETEEPGVRIMSNVPLRKGSSYSALLQEVPNVVRLEQFHAVEVVTAGSSKRKKAVARWKAEGHTYELPEWKGLTPDEFYALEVGTVLQSTNGTRWILKSRFNREGIDGLSHYLIPERKDLQGAIATEMGPKALERHASSYILAPNRDEVTTVRV